MGRSSKHLMWYDSTRYKVTLSFRVVVRDYKSKPTIVQATPSLHSNTKKYSPHTCLM